MLLRYFMSSFQRRLAVQRGASSTHIQHQLLLSAVKHSERMFSSFNLAYRASVPSPEGLVSGTTYHFRLVAKTQKAKSNPSISSSPPACCPLSSSHAPTTPCAADLRKTAPGRRLPDCRAYEQASPNFKNDTGPL